MGINKVIYSTTVVVKGGRDGQAQTEGGALDLTLAVPKEMGGQGNKGTNPEQLFAAGYAACFQSALRHTARRENKNVTESSVIATVGIGPRDEGGFGLKVDMVVQLSGVTREEAQQLINTVHAGICPYSNAIRGNVDVDIKVA